MTGSATLHFEGDAARRLEAIYATSDVVAQRRWTMPRLGLQPGERVIDTDWRTLVWHTRESERMRRVLACWDEHARHPHLPRTLAARLRRAGLVVDGVEIYPLLNPRLDEDTYSHGLIQLIAAFVAGKQGLGTAEAEAWEAELRELGVQDEYFMSLNRYLFAAHRPGAT
jgi:hypothetical protein